MKRMMLAALMAVLLAACGMSNNEIGKSVQRSMQSTFDTDAQYKDYKLAVMNVSVVKQTGNQYRGIAQVRLDGKYHDVQLEITADGEQVMWSAPPGSMMFVAQKAMEDAMAKATRESEASMKNLMASTANDAVAQYRMVKRQGDAMGACVHAGIVAASYLQANDESNYEKWHDVEVSDCRSAGVPR